MAFLITVLVIVVGGPILWQIPRTFWPVRLNSTGTAFTGLYRRYSVASFTGYASGVRESTESQRTYGGVTGYVQSAPGGSSVVSVSDGRRTFSSSHVHFFLTDQTGTTRDVDAANTGAVVGEGHLVSAGWLVHNKKPGNAFFVYNHTTNSVFVEASKRGGHTFPVPRGLVKMIVKLPLAYQFVLIVLIVTIPLLVVLAVGSQFQLRMFRKHGVRRLVAAVEQRAAEFPPVRARGAAAATGGGGRDLASQVKDIAALHDSGALSNEEFEAAKAKLLGN